MDPRRWQRKLAEAEARGLRRRLRSRSEAPIDLSTNDYLGLSRHPRLAEAAAHAAHQHGVGATASRLLGGNFPLHTDLEAEIADLKSAEAALVFSSGYAANVGMLSTLCDEGDVILCDRLDHASLVDGARMARAALHFYRHGDPESLRRRLERLPTEGHRWIVTDGVFSMDGDLAPLPELVELAVRHDATLIVDDAHATGVLGPEGRGSLAHFELGTEGVIQMGTLSKALATQGGYVAGSQLMVDMLVQGARSFIYSTGLGLPLTAAALEAVRLVRDDDEGRARLQGWCERLREGLRDQGWTVVGQAPAPMLGVEVGDVRRVLEVAAGLEEQGILVAAVRPPTVPRGRSRLRLAPRATLSEREIDRVLEAFSDLR